MKNHVKIFLTIIILSILYIAAIAQPNPKSEARQEKHKSKSALKEARKLRVKQDKNNIKHEKMTKKQDNMEHNKEASHNDRNAVKDDKKKKKDDKKKE